MSEQLGEAVLTLRTDDSRFTGGVTEAKGKAEELGGTLDATAGSAVGLADKLNQAASSGDRGAAAFLKAGTAIDQLASAQAQAKAEMTVSKAAFDAGTLSLEDYNRQVLQAKAGLATFEEEHRKAQAELRKSLSSTTALTGATAGQQAGVRQLTQNLGDMTTMYSMGMRPSQIFASQISQVAQAIQLTAGEGSKFAAFLANPWVAAATTATIVLGPLAAALFSSGDAADKAGKSNETWAEKLDASKHSITEVIAALKEYNSEQKKANETTLDAAAAAATAAAKKLDEAIAERQRLAALLASQQASAAGNAGQGTGGAAGAFTAGQLGLTEARVAENNRQIADLENEAKAAIGGIATQLAKLDTDPTARIRFGFDELRKRARASISDVEELRKRLAELNREETSALKAEQERKKGASGGSGAGPDQASTGDMVALIKDLFPGATITSTTGGKHTKGSDHYAGRAIDFVPAGGMGQYTTAEVEQMLRDAGVDIRRNASGTEQMFGPGRPAEKPGDHDDHFHVAWTGGASPEEAQRRKEQAQRREEQAAQTAARNQEAFNSDEARLNQALLQAKQQGLSDAGDIAASQRAQVQAEADRAAQSIAAAVASHKYSEAQGKILTDLNASVAAAKIERIDREQRAEQTKRSTDLQAGLLENEIDALRIEQAAAKTADDRRRIALQILDYETQIARLKLQQTIDNAKLGKATAEQAQIAQDALNKLDAGAAIQREGVIEQTAGPLESYTRGLSKTRAQNGERAEQLVVDELEYVQRSISDGIASKLGVKDPMLKGLIDMFVQQVFIRPLAEALNSEMAGMGGAGGGGFFGSLLSGIGSALGGGGVSLSSASIEGAGAYDFSSFSGMFAQGGTIPAGSWGIAGEAGPEPIFGGASGVGVMSNPRARQMFGGAQAPVIYDLRGAVTTEKLLAEMNEISRQNSASAVAGYDQVAGIRLKDQLARRG